MSVRLGGLPKFLVLEPHRGLRLDIRLAAGTYEIGVEVEGRTTGLSVILTLGDKGEPFAQRARLAGRARLHFSADSPGEYVIGLTNPMDRTVVVHLTARELARTTVPLARGHRAARNRASRPRDQRLRKNRSSGVSDHSGGM